MPFMVSSRTDDKVGVLGPKATVFPPFLSSFYRTGPQWYPVLKDVPEKYK